MANRYIYRINPKEVDFSLRATIISLCDYILQTAGEDADKNGFGTRNLRTDNLTWVLSRMAVEIIRFPNQYEEIIIETWVEDIGKIYTTRNFNIYDARQKLIGHACTYWAIINISTRSVQDILQYPTYTKCIEPTACPIAKPGKILPVKSEHPVDSHTVRYTDIDFNQHSNSTKYIGWMLDSLPIGHFLENDIQRLDINFLHESVYGNNIHIYRSLDETNTVFTLKRESGEMICNAKISWKKK